MPWVHLPKGMLNRWNQGPELIIYAGFEILVTWFPFFLHACADSKFPRSREEKRLQSRPIKADEARWAPKELYRPISLLCVLFKILERLIYAGVESIIDSLHLKEQAGLWRAGIVIDTVSVQNLLAPFCGVLVKDTALSSAWWSWQAVLN